MTLDFNDLLRISFEQTIGKPLYPYQQKILTNHSTFNIINKSRQMGITTILACYALWKAIIQDKTIIICSPSLRQSNNVMNYLQNFLRKLKQKIDVNILNENQSHVQFKNGGQIYSLPNSPETIVGLKADLLILDEFAKFMNDSDKQIIDALMPTLSRGGELWLISTPYGERGLYWQIWSDAKKYPSYNRTLLHYSECEDLAYQKMVAEFKTNMDSISFRQEYENEFIGDIDTFFPYNLLHSCINNDLLEFDTRDVLCYGVDFGRVQDATFIIGIQSLSNNKAIVKYIKELKGVRFSDQMAELNTLLSPDSRIECCVDMTGMGLPLFEQLHEKFGNRVRGITFSNEIKEKMIVNLKLRFEQQSIEIPNNAQLITQIHSIKRTQTSGQRAKYDSGREEEHHCYDEQTEILTENGWKFFKDLVITDKIAFLLNNELLYDFPIQIQQYDYSDEMIQIKNQQIDLLITPNHKVYVKPPNKTFQLKEAKDLFPKVKYEFKKNAEWKGISFDNEELLKFYGYFISEGFTNKFRSNYRVGICQKKETTLNNIRINLNKLGYKFYEQKSYDGTTSCIIYNKELHISLKVLGKSWEKYVPQFIKNLNKRQLNIFFDAMIEGDGYRGKQLGYDTSSPKLADDMQEIGIKLGYSVSLRKITKFHKNAHNKRPLYRLIFNKSRLTPQINKRQTSITKTSYKGKIYCCTSKTGIILVRRNYKYCWCGNSDAAWALSLALWNLDEVRASFAIF